MNSYDEVIEDLLSKHLFSVDLGLERIEKLLEQLGNPHLTSKVIHVAGTNGKGSTCAFLQAQLESVSCTVGVYTSPHLVDFRERIRIGSKKISKEDFVRLYKQVEECATNQTFFEIVTAMAFLYFSEQHVDFVVAEVGLGGRLDATNVVKPEVSIITSLGMDHIKHLGKTIDEIAFEKAGIIKEKTPIVLPASLPAREVIERTAKEQHAPVILVEEKKSLEEDFTHAKLKGSFQQTNFSLAETALATIGFTFTKEEKKQAIEQADWPGRFSFIKENVLVDCAHNMQAIQQLVKELQLLKEQKNYKKIICLTGIMKDKDYEHMILTLQKEVDEFVYVAPPLERATPPTELSNIAKGIVYNDFSQGVQETISSLKEKDLLLITGSIFTVGEVFSVLGLQPFNT